MILGFLARLNGEAGSALWEPSETGGRDTQVLTPIALLILRFHLEPEEQVMLAESPDPSRTFEEGLT